MAGSLRNTGIGQYTFNLLTALPRVAPDIELLAYGAPSEPRPAWLPAEVEWRSPRPLLGGRLAAIDTRVRALRGAARSDRLDLFHATAVHLRPSLPPVPSAGCPVVTTVHDVLPITHYRGDLPYRLRAFYRWNLRRAIASRRLVTVSGEARREISETLGVDPGRISVAGNGVDFPALVDPDAVARLGIRRPYVLYAGSYEPRKNLAGALQAFRKLVDAGREEDLVAIVERESGHAPAIHALMAELGLGERVHLICDLEDDALRAVYTHAELLVFTSFGEGFGFPPVQAAACGTPVVASDLPVLRETLGDAVELVDPHEPRLIAAAVGNLLANADWRRDLVHRARERAARFTTERFASEVAAVYRELTAASGSDLPVRASISR